MGYSAVIIVEVSKSSMKSSNYWGREDSGLVKPKVFKSSMRSSNSGGGGG